VIVKLALAFRNLRPDVDDLYLLLANWSRPFEMNSVLSNLNFTVPWTKEFGRPVIGVWKCQSVSIFPLVGSRFIRKSRFFANKVLLI